jgi:segregation and condensation protein A
MSTSVADDLSEISDSPPDSAGETVEETGDDLAGVGAVEEQEGAAAEQPQVRDPDRFTGHKIQLRIFEGPLDLLLYLIRGHRYDILDIPISEVTGQFIEFLRTMDELDKAAEIDIEYAGDFCVTAATLMQIKSRMLLPKTESVNEEEGEESEADPRRELVERLLEYQRMQSAAKELEELRDERSLLFNRPSLGELPIPPEARFDEDTSPEAQAALLLKDVSTFDLLRALSRVLRKVEERPVALIRREPFTLAERTRGVLSRFRAGAKLSFEMLCDDCESKLEVVITFLSVLELVRRGRIVVRQQAAFQEIWMEAKPGEAATPSL